MSYTFETTLSEADRKRFEAWWWRRAKEHVRTASAWRFWLIAAAVALASTALLVWIGVVERRDGGLVVIMSFALYLIGGFHAAHATQQDRRAVREAAGPERTYRTEIGEDGIWNRMPRGSTHCPWSAITSVDHWNGLLLVAAGPTHAFPVDVRSLERSGLDELLADMRLRMAKSDGAARVDV